MSIVKRLIETDELREQSCASRHRPLNILFFSHSTLLGGSERGVLELVAELIGDHDTVCTVVCPGEGPLVGELQAVGASTLVESELGWWAGVPANATEKRVASGARALLKLMPTLHEIDPDVVYTQTITIPWGATAAALLDKPHVWSICEFGELDHGLTFLDGFAEVIEQVKAGASFIRTSSEAVRTTLFPDLGSDRARTVYRHNQAPSAIEPSAGHFHREGATRLAVFGTLSEAKGQLDAVQAAATLIARGRDVELLLAGYSLAEYRRKVEASIERLGLGDRVRISDFLPDPYPTMLAADIILVCSRNEAFGRVVVDGMKLSRPVVYPSAGGIPEYMKDGVTGLSYAPGDIDQLVQRIEELMDDPQLAAQIGVEAKLHACATFTRNGSEIFRILRDLQGLRGRTDWRVAMPKRVVASLTSVAVQAEQDVIDAQNQLNTARSKYEESHSALRDKLRSTHSKYEKSHSALRDKLRTMHSKYDEANAKLAAIKNSRSFVLARAISWPSRWLKSRFGG